MYLTQLASIAAVLISVGTSEKPLTVRVLVLNFDPIVAQEGNKRLHEVLKWRNPKELADGYAGDIAKSSAGYIQYKVVEWRDVDAFPVKTDGFQYNVDSYLTAWRSKKGFHDPDGSDYEKICKDYGVTQLINANKIDELWIFGAPYFGFWESAMAGPGAFYINGGTYPKVPSKRPFAIMGFNYERGVAEMVHDLSHRTESTMARVYGGWQVEKLTTPWARFAANFKQSNGVAAVGTCHYPPNADHDYDYSNKRVVDSSADDWLNWPKLTGATKPTSCETWGGPDYQRNYLNWWFARLPHVKGVGKDGRQLNWWKYIFDFNRYTELGQVKK